MINPIYENGLLHVCWSLLATNQSNFGRTHLVDPSKKGGTLCGIGTSDGNNIQYVITHIVDLDNPQKTVCGIDADDRWEYEQWDSLGRGVDEKDTPKDISHVKCSQCSKSAFLKIDGDYPRKSISDRVDRIEKGDVLYFNGVPVTILANWFEDDGDRMLQVYEHDAGSSLIVKRHELTDVDGTPVVDWNCVTIHDGKNAGNRGTWFTTIGGVIYVRTGRDGNDHHYEFSPNDDPANLVGLLNSLLHGQAWMYTNQKEPLFINPMNPLQRVIEEK